MPTSMTLSGQSYFMYSSFLTPSSKNFSFDEAFEVADIHLDLLEEDPPNIVVFIMESTRKDALSFYNPSLKKQTVFFDSLANQGMTFDGMHAVVPFTIKAMTAINCGVAPYMNYPILESTQGIPSECLPKKLSQLGYQTTFIQSSTNTYGNIKSLVEKHGFQSSYGAEDMNRKGFKRLSMAGYEDDVMLETSAEQLDSLTQPFFIQYLTLGPHFPYIVTKSSDSTEYLSKLEEGEYIYDFGRLYNRYLNTVQHQDQFLQTLFAQFEERNLTENTVFLFVGDHGQGFGEHRHYQHANNPYQTGLAVPFMIYAPKYIQSDRVEQLLNHTDVSNILSNILSGKEALHAVQRDVSFAACWYWRWCAVRIDSQYKYIHNFGDAKDELYDLLNDLSEKTNIAEAFPEQVLRFRQETLAWYQQQLNRYAAIYKQDRKFYLSGHPKEFVNEDK